MDSGQQSVGILVQFADEVVISVTDDGTIVGWNAQAARFYGYSADEMIGNPIGVLFPAEATDFARTIESIARSEPMDAHDAVRRCKNGTLVNVAVALFPVVSSPDLFDSARLDRNARRLKVVEAQFVAAQKNEVVGQLASGVAHDFNNMLAIILGYSDILLAAIAPGDPKRVDVEEIRRASQRAAGLTRQLLIFSRRQTVDPVILDLNREVANHDRMLRQLIDENIILELVPDPVICCTRADAGHIGQVLMNLVVNARDAMPFGGHLTITTANVTVHRDIAPPPDGVPDGDYVRLSVRDTGTGMTDAVKARLFEAFFTTKPPGAGTGLGMVTCKTIMAQSAGYISVHSELDIGTTVSAYFPCVNATLFVEPLAVASVPEYRGTETLLLVEDEPALRHLACAVLESHGYTVLPAANGHEGLRVARMHQGEPIRIVITDVVMPLMGGRAMAEWLQASDRGLRILFTSGYTDDTIAPHGVLDRGVAFLPKPYTPLGLAQSVRNVLDAPFTALAEPATI